tara:strand:- start:283 stop:480 length:198 start_codon:yes stop_codon:yes gene_type:complete
LAPTYLVLIWGLLDNSIARHRALFHTANTTGGKMESLPELIATWLDPLPYPQRDLHIIDQASGDA